jgi:hypothetical protein
LPQARSSPSDRGLAHGRRNLTLRDSELLEIWLKLEIELFRLP